MVKRRNGSCGSRLGAMRSEGSVVPCAGRRYQALSAALLRRIKVVPRSLVLLLRVIFLFLRRRAYVSGVDCKAI